MESRNGCRRLRISKQAGQFPTTAPQLISPVQPLVGEHQPCRPSPSELKTTSATSVATTHPRIEVLYLVLHVPHGGHADLRQRLRLAHLALELGTHSSHLQEERERTGPPAGVWHRQHICVAASMLRHLKALGNLLASRIAEWAWHWWGCHWGHKKCFSTTGRWPVSVVIRAHESEKTWCKTMLRGSSFRCHSVSLWVQAGIA